MNTNFLKTVLLLTALTVLLVLLGKAIAGTSGMVVALVFAALMNFFSYWFSDKIALAMSGAREVSYDEAPQLYRLVEQVAQWARIPRPRVYIIESESPNAFATGRDPNHAAVAVTTGILRLLDERELAGVLAHELGHIRNRDTLIMTVVATIAGAITMIANMAQWALFFGGGRSDDEDSGMHPLAALLMIIVAPIVATLIQLAISRAREFEADATGARICGDPLALASALEKLERGAALLPLNPNPATAHLYIVNPFGGGGWQSLFMTHPPIAERIARLRAMAMRPALSY
ncbi:MAG TPA: zinc metalloprotease HtpX [Chloroflexota bacterium]|nr:zinc metalloprotease HtpX [Chloroflexota bacterium]HZU05197.1 zinc metalloprotease HtpX [Chloroflexota bacterium]